MIVKALLWTSLFVCMLALGGCKQANDNSTADEPAAATDEPKTFDKHSITFTYPGNWSVEDEVEEIAPGASITTISVESPGFAILMLMSMSPAEDVDLQEFGEMFLSQIGAEVRSASGGLATASGGNKKNTRRKLLGEEREALLLTYSAQAIGETIPHTAYLYQAKLEGRTIIIITQVADEDSKAATPGFDLILDSLAAK